MVNEIKIMKKPIVLSATRVAEDQEVQTDRGEILSSIVGDWIIETENGEKWPVSHDYLQRNYDVVSE